MDTASSDLLARARGGQPLAIANLMQQQLNDDNIDITGWRRSTTVHLELLSFERTDKAQALTVIRQLLNELSPEAVDAVRVSCYLYGDDRPCWIDRVAAPGADQAKTYSMEPRPERLGQWLNRRLPSPQRRLATVFLGLLMLWGLLWRPSPSQPSFVQQEQTSPIAAEDSPRPIRARRSSRPKN